MKIAKKILIFGLCATLVSGVTGCSKDEEKNVDSSINNDALQSIKTGMDNLENFSDTYIISNILEAPDGTVSYINVNSTNGNYIEYPVDKEGNLGVVDNDSEEVTYTLTDWLTSDNSKYYLLVNNNESSSFTYLPDDFAKTISSRKVLYLDLMIDNFTSVEDKGTTKLDFGNGDELVNIYKCELPSECIQKVLGINTVGMYESIKNSTENADITKFCDFYISDTKRNLACSDAIVNIGIDSTGLVRYVGAEVGGLGTRMYYSMTVITDFKDQIRDIPNDLSSATSYEDSIKEYASFVAKYDSYSDALNAMYSQQDNNDSSSDGNILDGIDFSDITDDELEDIKDNVTSENSEGVDANE